MVLVLVITLNPSIDRIYNVKELKTDKSYKVRDYQYTVGGKGINVAKVLREFNEEVIIAGL